MGLRRVLGRSNIGKTSGVRLRDAPQSLTVKQVETCCVCKKRFSWQFVKFVSRSEATPGRLEIHAGLWDFSTMNAVKVDEAHRIRLSVLKPEDLYETEVHGPAA